MINLITEHIGIWTSAQTPKNGIGRGSGATNGYLYGIKKLRELILELAIRGKLVPQDQKDEPANVLLKEIRKEKLGLIKAGILRKNIPVREIRDDEKLFALPSGWEFCRIGTLANSISSGGTPNKRIAEFWNGDIPWASVKDLGKAKYLERTQDFITQQGLDSGSKLADIGDVVICTRMGLGKIAIAKVKVAINQDLKAIKLTSLLDVDFFLYYFKTLNIKGTGTTVEGIRQDELLDFIFPLPPLAEQNRIVAKVDELMALCDQLEKQQSESNTAHQILVKTFLNILTTASNHDEFDEAWQRIAEYFDILFTTEQSIDQLKQTILQLAVMGKLVPHDPTDEPAGVLLKKIAKEKEKLIKEGKIKRDDPLPEVAEGERPFISPTGWVWTRLGNLSADIHYGYTASANNQIENVRLLRITDIQNDFVDWQSVPGCEIDESKISTYKLENGDILIARTGGTIGKSFLVLDIVECAIFASYLIRIKRIDGMYSPFIKVYLGSQLYWDQLYVKSMGTGQPNVNGNALKNLKVALPPFLEQYRIVAKIDELKAICDTLKARLKDIQTTQVQLADSIVEQAIA